MSGRGYGFGTFKGVFTPSILTIVGVVMYLRFGWVLGNVGLARALLVLVASSAITFLTGLSVAALSTNMRVRGGGAYYMVSRSFGIEVGAAVGIPLFLSQAIAAAFYATGFAEAFRESVPFASGWDPRVLGLATLAALAALTFRSADLALKAQYGIMAAIGLSLVSFFLGRTPDPAALRTAADVAPLGLWPVLAVFFPAVTGILAGIGMSGDLRDPGRALPVGTVAAVLTGLVVYGAVVVALDRFAAPLGEARRGVLLGDPMFLMKCSRWPALVVLGVWAACLSSALGSLLSAPRVLQALSRDRATPRLFGRGFGAGDDPRYAAALSLAVAAAVVCAGDVNEIAGVLTMFTLMVYCLLNLSAGCEELLGNPSWRPTFRVPAALSFLGFAGSLAMMFMISAGSTFVALGCIALVFWLMQRRAMRARWGDMRFGLAMAAARFAIRRLSTRSGGERNWRPVLLVLAGSPAKRRRLVEMAGAISQNRSLVTVASVIPEEAWSVERGESLRRATRAYLDDRGIEAQVRIQPGETTWGGIRELVRAYGWGPLVPNTVLLGPARRDESAGPCAGLVRMLASRRRNVVIVADNADNADNAADRPLRTIDIWWRGGKGNAPFMLALAHLLLREGDWRGARLRVCHLAEGPERVEDARRMLEAFLAGSRVAADCVVLPPNTVERPIETICRASAGSDLVFLGLRQPGEGEEDASYGAYLRYYETSTASLPMVVFALAAEDVDFRAIFA